MQFIKENVFYSVLIGILVVVGGGLVAMGYVGGSATDAKQQAKVDESKRAADLLKPSGTFVNPRVIAAKKLEVTMTESMYARVAADEANWNRGRYKPIMLDKMAGGKKIGEMPLFPIVRADHVQYDASFVGSSRFRKLTAELFAGLHPATPPTQDEIGVEVDRLKEAAAKVLRKKLLIREWEALERKIRGEDAVEGEGEGEGEGAGGVDPARPGIGGVIPSVRPGAGLGKDGADAGRGKTGEGEGGDTTAVEVDYETHALNNMRIFKAGLKIDPDAKTDPEEVSIYIDPATVIDPVFAAATAQASDSDLWNAQTQLWILGDIVDAIARINDKSLKVPGRATPARRTVPASAIKHLVKVNIPISYVTSSQDDDMDMTAGRMGGIAAGGANLTQRLTNTKHDVKHYSFTVVMDVQYLPDLQRILLVGNHHTILNVTMRSIETPADAADVYYYGTDPVMEVTIDGELLMLADWTRGMWDGDRGTTKAEPAGPTEPGSSASRRGRQRTGYGTPKPTVAKKLEGKWEKEFPPLMPVSVLKEIYRQDPGALRPVDIQRMTQKPE